MKGKSVVGPLILILLGVLLLINTLRPEVPLLEILARYWPFLLIGWGLLRLLEILVWSIRSKPVPGQGISGGEWAIIVLICVVGSLTYFAARRVGFHWPHGRISARGVEIFGEAYDYPVSEARAAGKSPRVLVDNLRGNARIVGTEGEEIRVTGRKTVRAFDRSSADKASAQSPLEIVEKGGQFHVRTNQERVEGDRKLSVDLEVAVPRGASVEGRGRYGDFDITGIDGNVFIESDNAGVRLQSIGGSARVELARSDIVRAINVKGNVDVKMTSRGDDVELENIEGQSTVTGTYSGELRFRNLAKGLRFQSSQTDLRVERIPGQFSISLGRIRGENLVGPIRISTRSRDIELSDFTQSLEVSVERGDIELSPRRVPLAKIEARTRSGDVGLSIPPGAAFSIKASTDSGPVDNEFGAPLKVEEEGRGGSIQGTVGQGPELRLTTQRGRVFVRKASPAVSRVSESPAPKAAKRLKVEVY